MAHHKERLALISIFHIFDSLGTNHIRGMSFINLSTFVIHSWIVSPFSLLYQLWIYITSLSRKDVVVVKSGRFSVQMPFTKDGRLVTCLLQTFSHIGMIRIQRILQGINPILLTILTGDNRSTARSAYRVCHKTIPKDSAFMRYPVDIGCRQKIR